MPGYNLWDAITQSYGHMMAIVGPAFLPGATWSQIPRR